MDPLYVSRGHLGKNMENYFTKVLIIMTVDGISQISELISYSSLIEIKELWIWLKKINLIFRAEYFAINAIDLITTISVPVLHNSIK